MLVSRVVGRRARRELVGLDTTNHCSWRAHNLTLVLDAPEAKDKFLSLVAEYKVRHGILIHSYCLMGTHPHMQTRSTKGQKDFSKFWKVVNQRFAVWFNRLNGRRGQVVMDRLQSPRVTDGEHQLTVMRYGDLNPVRAGLVESPGQWPWSSYRHYAFGEANPLITDAPEYLALGRTPAERRRAYVHFFATKLVDTVLRRRPDLVYGAFIPAGEASRRPQPRKREPPD